MATSFRDGAMVGLCLMAMVVVGSIGAEAQLSTQFYNNTCPQIYDIVKAEIQTAVEANPRNAAFLVRLHFHDCFVNGCDGSILLDNTTTNVSEQYSIANQNSIGGLDIIATIKAKLETACPQTVSCADIVAIASRDSAVEVGLSPGYPVFFGRRDSLTFNISAADQFLPAPTLTYPGLVKNFAAVGLDEVDLVALSGAHTIGRARCSVVTLFTNDSTSGFNPGFQLSSNNTCLNNSGPVPVPINKVVNLDTVTPDFFDNWYYKNLLNGEGRFRSDQVLFSTVGGISQPLVAEYAFDPEAFAAQFALSTIKMGNIIFLNATEGEIRLNCSVINDATSPNATSPSGSTASLIATQ